jgi:hypothetical protein
VVAGMIPRMPPPSMERIRFIFRSSFGMPRGK